MPLTENVNPIVNSELREMLLKYHLNFATSQELSEWLRDLGQDHKGTVEEKISRVRQHTQYLSMSPETFVAETLRYLRDYSTDLLIEICRTLRLNIEGSNPVLTRRIYREIGIREGWLHPLSKEISVLNKEVVLPFVNWYPILKNGKYEKDYYTDFYDEMVELFGRNNVHKQLPIAHGNTLRIDFHLGHPQQGGVGIEFKMPTNNSEIQRALGQIDQYVHRYSSELIIVLIPDFIDTKQAIQFKEELHRKGVDVVVKTKIG